MMEKTRLRLEWVTSVVLILILGLQAMSCLTSQKLVSNYATIRSDKDMERSLGYLSNWGKWGPEDERGTLNYITQKSIQEARKLIVTGTVITLAREVSVVSTQGIREASYRMYQDGMASRDFIGAIWHGFAQTHLDALCHIYADTMRLYNGFSKNDISAAGAKRLGIENMAESGIVGRGVLLDMVKAKGFILSAGTPIFIKDIEAAIAKQKVKIKSGDVLFIRTGAGVNNTREKRSGLHPECLLWIKEKQIALLGADGDNDVYPLENFERWSSAFHSVGIPYLGLPLIDGCELEKLSVTCEQHNRWEFFVTISPWKLEGATSSPINPIAVF